MGFFDNLLAPFTGKPIEEAARAKEASIREGLAQQTAAYGSGRGALTDQYTKALQPFEALQPAAMGGYNAYADISGAAGRAGQDRARAMFQTDPGYEFSVNQQIDAMNRAANARGVAVGTSTSDVGNMVAGRASQQYGDYVNRLLPWLGQGLGVAGGQANIYTGLGGELNRSFTGQGDAAARAFGAIGGAQAEGALAPMAAGSNIWNAGLNLGKLAMGSMGAGGMFGQGGAFGAPFNPNPYDRQSSPLQS